MATRGPIASVDTETRPSCKRFCVCVSISLVFLFWPERLYSPQLHFSRSSNKLLSTVSYVKLLNKKAIEPGLASQASYQLPLICVLGRVQRSITGGLSAGQVCWLLQDAHFSNQLATVKEILHFKVECAVH